MHTHTLLIADDSITIQRVIQLTFADEPIKVLVAANGQQALDCIEAERPDIVLACTDVPGVDGYAIARYVSGKRHLRKLPVLLLTNRFESSNELRVKESGAKGVVEKPLEPGILMARVKHALGISTPAAEPVPAVPARKQRRPAARRLPAAGRSASPKARKAKPRRVSPVLGPGITHEALAQIVGGAVAHAVVHAIDAYERTLGLSPAPANDLAAPLPKRPQATPMQSSALPPLSTKVSL
ncbi:MAG: response regulator, partial [Vicinamibacterales bacterium]